MTATYHGRYRRTCCPTTDCAPRRLLPGSTSPFSECIPFGFPLGHPPCLYFSSRIALTLVFPHRDSSPTWPMNKNSRVTLGRVATYRPDLGSGAVGPVSLGDPRVLLLIGLSGRPVLGGKTTLLWLQVPSHGYRFLPTVTGSFPRCWSSPSIQRTWPVPCRRRKGMRTSETWGGRAAPAPALLTLPRRRLSPQPQQRDGRPGCTEWPHPQA